MASSKEDQTAEYERHKGAVSTPRPDAIDSTVAPKEKPYAHARPDDSAPERTPEDSGNLSGGEQNSGAVRG